MQKKKKKRFPINKQDCGTCHGPSSGGETSAAAALRPRRSRIPFLARSGDWRVICCVALGSTCRHRRVSDITAATSQHGHLGEGVTGSAAAVPPRQIGGGGGGAFQAHTGIGSLRPSSRPTRGSGPPAPPESCSLCILTISII